MKKIISLAIILSMLFTMSASAFTVIQHNYIDVDGTHYHIGEFNDGDTDAGLMVNGKKYSLKNGIYLGESRHAFEEASGKSNGFAMGLRFPEDYSEESYSMAPYSVDEDGNTRIGQSRNYYFNDEANYTMQKSVEVPVVADVYNGENTQTLGSGETLRQEARYLPIKCDANALSVSNHALANLSAIASGDTTAPPRRRRWWRWRRRWNSGYHRSRFCKSGKPDHSRIKLYSQFRAY